MKTLTLKMRLLKLRSEIIRADTDGGPRSRIRTAGHSALPPIEISRNFLPHLSAEQP